MRPFRVAQQVVVDAPSPVRPSTSSVELKAEPRFELQAPAPATTSPLGPGRYKVQLTAGQALHDKLQQARLDAS